MKNTFSTLKLLLTGCLIPLALVCRADESLNYARVFEALCVASKLEAQQISAALNLQEKHKFVEKADLSLSSPDADAGAVFLNTGTVYFVTYGERSSSFGGAFCSVGTEGFGHSDVKRLVKNYFSTLSFVADERIGGSKVSIYKGFLPGLPDNIAVGIQSDFGVSVLSLFIVE